MTTSGRERRPYGVRRGPIPPLARSRPLGKQLSPRLSDDVGLQQGLEWLNRVAQVRRREVKPDERFEIAQHPPLGQLVFGDVLHPDGGKEILLRQQSAQF